MDIESDLLLKNIKIIRNIESRDIEIENNDYFIN